MFVGILDNQIAVFDCFNQREELKSRYGASFNKQNKAWTIPMSFKVLKELKERYGAIMTESATYYVENYKATLEILGDIKTNKKPNKYDLQSTITNAKLMKHQQTAGNLALTLFDRGRSGVMLDMEMGTGKTMTAMAIAGMLEDVKKILVICPKISLRVWQREYEKFANYDYCLAALEGTAKKRLQAMQELIDNEKDYGKSIVVINYEYVYTFENILAKWRPDLIICDESHKIKSPTAQQTKSILRLGRLAMYKICLTGTPLTNNILDFFSQYKFLDSSVLGDSYTAYKNKYVITGMFNEYLRPNPATFQELKARLATISYRVTKEECLDLPPFTDIYLPVEFSDKNYKLYKQFEKEFVVWLNEHTQVTTENALTQTLKLRQLTGGFCYDYNSLGERTTVNFDDAKLNACAELIENIVSGGNKVIVFAEFQAEIENIKKVCDDLKIKAVTYYGGTSEKAKNNAYEEFTNGDAMVFIGQIESAGISITLTNSKYTIFYSTGYKYGSYDQARSRMHRKGQTQKCTYYHLVVKDTIDERINKSLENKEKLAETIIDSYRKGV